MSTAEPRQPIATMDTPATSQKCLASSPLTSDAHQLTALGASLCLVLYTQLRLVLRAWSPPLFFVEPSFIKTSSYATEQGTCTYLGKALWVSTILFVVLPDSEPVSVVYFALLLLNHIIRDNNIVHFLPVAFKTVKYSLCVVQGDGSNYSMIGSAICILCLIFFCVYYKSVRL